MKDLFKVIQTYDDSKVLLVSDFRTYIVANEILKTVKLLQRYDPDKHELFEQDVIDTFKLDINNNNFHMILWENWMNFISDIDLIDIGTRWGNGTHTLSATDKDVEYLEYIIKNKIDIGVNQNETISN